MAEATDLELLDKVGLALFRTVAWAPQLAQYLGVPLRTMQRIAKAHREGRSYPVPPEWFVILRNNLRNQAAHYSILADELEERAANPTATPMEQIPELLAAAGGYIVWERAFPHGTLKADIYSPRDAGGHLMVFRGPLMGTPTLTRAQVEQWVREGRLLADPMQQSGFVVFKPRKE